MKRLVLALLLFSVLSMACAQRVKSLPKTLVLSALLPGSGQLYNGNPSKAAVFFSAEAALWIGYARLNQEVKWSENNFQQFALVNAGLPLHSSDQVYRAANNFQSSDLFNQQVEVNIRNNLLILVGDETVPLSDREFYASLLNDQQAYQEFLKQFIYTAPETWDWGNIGNFKKYHELRQDRQQMLIFRNFAFGAILLNHIISTADAVIMNRRAKREQSKLGYLDIKPDFTKKGVKLVYTVRF
jgi:hypothetical protein